MAASDNLFLITSILKSSVIVEFFSLRNLVSIGIIKLAYQTYSLNIAQGLQGAPGFCTKEQVNGIVDLLPFYHGFPE